MAWALSPLDSTAFLSTLSLRRATDTESARDRPKEFLSTLSLRRATCILHHLQRLLYVSIHALLAESDIPLALLCRLKLSFYPRSPCGERPQLASYFCQRLSFYPRSPCGERPLKKLLLKRLLVVSIHALLAESDACITIITICTVLFLSTLSLRRATSKDEH